MTKENVPNIPEPILPDRPLECSECRKPIQVIYTEVVGKSITRTAMCGECPILEQKLHGSSVIEKGLQESPAHLCCGSCGVSLDEVKMGAPIGCPLCYDIFAEEIIHELYQLERIPPKAGILRKGNALHTGRGPSEPHELEPSLKLIALQQALHETLGREDYEQAARLRDQIRAIEEQKQGQGGVTDGGTKK
jgi:protein arginine kinase activator